MEIFPADQLWYFAAAVCAGVFTQSATGFAGGLVMLPLMLWVGHGIPEAQTALLCSTLPQNLLGVFTFRDTVEIRAFALPALLRLVALPVGVGTLYYVDDFPVSFARQLVGGVVIGCVLLMIFCKPKTQQQVPLKWTSIAFLTSGFFVGLTGTGGPFMVLWVQAHDWSTRRSRSFLFMMYLLSIPPVLGLLYATFGDRILRAFFSSLLLVPLILLVSQLGLRLGSRLGRERLRRVTFAVLLLIGVLGVLAPILARPSG